MNYNHLYYFYVVARSGSVTAAAKELGIAQPALSSQIKVLESSMALKLFQRVGRSLQLSPEGEVAFMHCQRIFDAAEVMQSELLGMDSGKFRLKVGIANDIERPFLVAIVGALLKKKANASVKRIKMHSDSNETLFKQLRSMNLDAVITTEPTYDADFVTLESAKMAIVLAYNPEGQHKKLDGITPALLRNLARDGGLVWALPQKSMKLRLEIDQFFEKFGIDPEIAFESDILATIVRAVVDGVGVAFLPRPYISEYSRSRNIKWTGPKDGFWKHGIWLIVRKRDAELEKMKALQTAFRQTLEKE